VAGFYRGAGEFLRLVVPFVREGVALSEPVLVVVAGEDARLAGAALGGVGGVVVFGDAGVVGGNPARVTLALTSFAARYGGRRVRFVAEPLWPGRSGAEVAEVLKHEALVNVVLAEVPARVLCLFDVSWVGAGVLAGVRGAHPGVVAGGGGVVACGDYAGPGVVAEAALGGPPLWARSLAYGHVTGLGGVRALVGGCARECGLPAGRCEDLVLAVGELTANTLAHAGGGGVVHVWVAGGQVLCQVHDGGRVGDRLAGRRCAPPASRGHGLRVVNEVCDLVEMRTGPGGTTVRVRMTLPGQ
jgi:anti-sigma regulatory factor (Ser/Thr protein kinase)